jgi:anion-transporting  ArsA/GET3 family ATPase
MKTPRLHVLLGAGGVGKTTLAAGYALALARSGRRVGLLGIDPSRRLQGALGLELPELEVLVPGVGELHAALLRPEDSMRRWAADACPDPDLRTRLLANKFFLALADRLAAATDLLAAARIAEWAERDPALTDLVVDTAPGLNAIEFLRKPQSLAAFLEGGLVRWLRWLARSGTKNGLFKGAARRVIGGLDRLGGTPMLLELAEFLSLVEELLARMLDRVTKAQAWISSPSTELLLIAAVRDDAAHTAGELAKALGELNLSARATVVNRALPQELGPELERLDDASLAPDALPFVRYARGYSRMQQRVISEVTPLARTVAVIPAWRGLDEDTRLDALSALGERLLGQLTK